jgi:hypothetical protein
MLGPGAHTLTATAADVAGDTAAGSATFTIVSAGFGFAVLTAELEVDTRRPRFEVEGALTLDPRSDGIDLLTENVSLTVGGMTLTIPKGSFKRELSGSYTFKGLVDARRVEVPRVTAGVFAFEFEFAGPDPTAGQGRLAVQVTIENDSGTALARVERGQ